MATAEIAIAYIPPSQKLIKITSAIKTTGKMADFIPIDKPAIILVPCPDKEAFAIALTGLYFLEVKYSVIKNIPPASKSPSKAGK